MISTDPSAAELRDALRQEIERLKKQVGLLHDATIVLRNGMGGHNHWDDTMQRGAGCQICIEQRKALKEAERIIDEAAILTS